MAHSFFWGPDRVPFKLLEDCTVQSEHGVPFHGIISFGMKQKFEEANLNPQIWHDYSHTLDKTYSSIDLPKTENFSQIESIAKTCALLSFGESAFCIKLYIDNFCLKANDELIESNCWNIKEGHYSSVWKIILKSKVCTDEFVLNVARDKLAGEHLKLTSMNLKKLCKDVYEVKVAEVYDIKELEHEKLPCSVVITKNEWIANAFEIHSRKNKLSGEEELLMIERFLTDQERPAKIISVLGRVLSEKETQKINSGLEVFLTQVTSRLSKSPNIIINNGDVVWDGKKAVLVAIS